MRVSIHFECVPDDFSMELCKDDAEVTLNLIRRIITLIHRSA
jgi:hypothetical protein